MMSKVAKCILTLLILAISPGLCFWNAGHMIVARIAHDQIKEKNPFVLHTIEHSINKLKDFSNEDKYPFVECAIWPDENKHIGMEAFNQWHYEDEPYITSDFSGTLMQPQSINITWSINQMKKALLNKNNERMSQDMTHSFAWRYTFIILFNMYGEQ